MRVLVTGGAGFIGSHLVDALVERGDDVHVIDDLSTGSWDNVPPSVELLELDVRDPRAADWIARARPDVIFHEAAQMSVSQSVRDPLHDVDVNVRGSLQLALAAAGAGSRFIFASTGGAMYGDATVLPTPEDYPAWPVSPYGASKLAVEHYLHAIRSYTGLDYVSLRYANVYGPRQNPHGEAGVIAIFNTALLIGGPYEITGDGCQTRDYIYVTDVVAACLAALHERCAGQTYNVGTGRQTSVNELFGMISATLRVAAPAVHGLARAAEQRTSALESSRLRRDVGWAPQVTLEAGLRSTAEWFRERLGFQARAS